MQALLVILADVGIHFFYVTTQLGPRVREGDEMQELVSATTHSQSVAPPPARFYAATVAARVAANHP